MITINSNFPPCVATTYIVELHENSQVKKKIFTVNFFKKNKRKCFMTFHIFMTSIQNLDKTFMFIKITFLSES